jgi:two-component system, chemotaxis family, response regulator Rcp1
MTTKINILLVEDSRADARLIEEVFAEEKISVDINVVRNGEEAMAYLRKEGPYKTALRPDLVLLDLNMPKKDGREVLAELKADDSLKSIPVVILTTSQAEEDVLKSYELQASCYVTKPIDLDKFIKIIRSLDDFWFSAVKFPENNVNANN